MKKVLLYAAIIAAFASCKKESSKPESPSASAEVEANWSSTDKWATWSNGGYTIANDVWGSGAGPQTIWANSYSNWGVWSNQYNQGGIKSYPHSSRNINKSLSSLHSVKSSFNCTTPNGGAWDSAYDIWDQSYQNETMLWFNWTSNFGPISYNYNSNGAIPVYTNVNVGGYTWNVYRGNNGANNVYSFLCTSKRSSGTVDILAIQRWIQSKGWFGNITQGDVQYGFEIGLTNGGANFQVNSYSVSYN